MKAGIWGTGVVAHTHAEAIIGDGVPIGAVVDIDLLRAEAFAELWGAEKYDRDSSILFSDDITVVHVCTPSNLHYEMVMKLLESGKHVLCEKPLCLEVAQANEIVRYAKEKSLICAVNYNVRFHDACRRAIEVVASPDFGPIHLIHGSYLQEFHSFPAPMGWRYDNIAAGKMRAVTEIGSHWMDLAEYISGIKITHVSAVFRNFHPTRAMENGIMTSAARNPDGEMIDIDSEDAATVNFRFEGGAIGTALFSEVSPGRVNRLSLEVTGTHQNLWWNSEENNVLNVAQKEDGVNTIVNPCGNGFTDTFRALIGEYYKDVRAGVASSNPVYPTLETGARVVKLCHALMESDRNGAQWVEV